MVQIFVGTNILFIDDICWLLFDIGNLLIFKLFSIIYYILECCIYRSLHVLYLL